MSKAENWDDKNFVLEQVRYQGRDLEFASDRLKAYNNNLPVIDKFIQESLTEQQQANQSLLKKLKKIDIQPIKTLFKRRLLDVY
jgi:hypothetical protein